MTKSQTRIWMVVAAILFASTVTAAPVRPVTVKGYCVGVVAADTLEVWTDVRDQVVTVLLAGVDGSSLELFPFFAEQEMRGLAQDRPVRLEVYDRRPDGVLVARVFAGGRDLAYHLVAEGLARPHARAPIALGLDQAEEQARLFGRGMWFDPDAEEKRIEMALAAEPRLSDIAWQLDYRRGLKAVNAGDSESTGSLGTWVGSHRSALVSSLGPPSWTEVEADGSEVLVYGLCRGQDWLIATGICTLRYRVDATGYITARSWER